MYEPGDVIGSFDIYGDFLGAEPYGGGHINHTYKAVFDQAGRRVNYLLQRVNGIVFPKPVALMENVAGICDHLKTRAEEEGLDERSRRVLTLIPSSGGIPWVVDDEGGVWRCYLFIEGAVGYDVVRSGMQAREAARCFGEYQQLLADLPGGRLTETIENFHNTPRRFENLMRAVEADSQGLAASVSDELEFFRERSGDAGLLLNLLKTGKIPERVTHNDTKLNNVLIDEKTDRGMCVIDLDTSMPGLSLYDFGDLVRTSTSPVPEDHPRSDEVRMNMDMFRSLADGYLEPGRKFLNETEILHLPEGGRLMTMEVGMRFLTDYLGGSVFFRTAYAEHNLVRCRTQIALVKSIEEHRDEMRACLDEVMSGGGGR